MGVKWTPDRHRLRTQEECVQSGCTHSGHERAGREPVAVAGEVDGRLGELQAAGVFAKALADLEFEPAGAAEFGCVGGGEDDALSGEQSGGLADEAGVVVNRAPGLDALLL